MNPAWQLRDVPLRFQVSSWTAFAPTLRVQVSELGLTEGVEAGPEPSPPSEPLADGSRGFLIRALPLAEGQPALFRSRDYLCYVASRYPRHFVDLRQGFAEYGRKFSAKTRSTIQRKIRRYTDHCGGELRWKAYAQAGEMAEFVRLARIVSARTYQERLLDAGLPGSDDFVRGLEAQAAAGQLRAYLLFDRERPVSYLCCPIRDDVVRYEYVGYDPDYVEFSVGTILQWLALEQLFEEGRFRAFDFTEGDAEHKRLFATGSVRCANVFFLTPGLRNRVLVHAHRAFCGIAGSAGAAADRLGLKPTLRKLGRKSR